MSSSTHSQGGPVPKGVRWAGYVVSAVPALMLVGSGIAKVTKAAPVVEGFGKFGYPEHLIVGIGILELACTLVYLIPQTAVLGAILLTGYLGGATATHLRVGESFAAPVALGVLLWLGLVLRDRQLRAVLPLRR